MDEEKSVYRLDFNIWTLQIQWPPILFYHVCLFLSVALMNQRWQLSLCVLMLQYRSGENLINHIWARMLKIKTSFCCFLQKKTSVVVWPFIYIMCWKISECMNGQTSTNSCYLIKISEGKLSYNCWLDQRPEHRLVIQAPQCRIITHLIHSFRCSLSVDWMLEIQLKGNLQHQQSWLASRSLWITSRCTIIYFFFPLLLLSPPTSTPPLLRCWHSSDPQRDRE